MNSHAEIPGLTGMRGLAALYVLIFHLGTLGVLVSVPFFRPFQEAGWSGVAFFFVLSGYLLYGLYSERGVRKTYFVRRVFRTFPLYYLSLPLYIVAGLLVFSPLDFLYAQDYLRTTFAVNPIWTLAIEELFYFLLLPFIVKFRVNRTLLLAASAVISLAWCLAFPPADYFNKQMPAWFVCYAIGIWLSGRKVGGTKKLLAGAAGGLTFASVFASPLGGALSPGAPLVFGAAYGLLMVGMLDSPLFNNRLVHAIGKASYGIYILQLPLMVLFGPIPGALLTLGLSAVSWQFFESRLVEYGRRIKFAVSELPQPGPL